jgi:hypothetical protein
MEFILAILIGVGVDHLLTGTTHYSEHLCSSAGWSAGLLVLVLAKIFVQLQAKRALKIEIKKKGKELADLHLEEVLVKNSNKPTTKEIEFKF